MGYEKSTSILPPELIQQIQKYVDGKYIFPVLLKDEKTGEIIRTPVKHWL